MNEFAGETLILSVETSTRGGSLAILKNSEVSAIWHGAENFSLSDGLLPEIQNILRQSGIKLSEIDLLAATIGPGSFTDLRIGLATVKGLATVWNIPVCGVPTLAAMAFGHSINKTIAAFQIAGRDEVFAQIFRPDTNKISDPLKCGKLEQILFELEAESVLNLVAPLNLHQNIREFIKDQQQAKWIITPPPQNLAAATGKIAFDLFGKNNLTNDSWQIIYGRDALNLRNKKA